MGPIMQYFVWCIIDKQAHDRKSSLNNQSVKYGTFIPKGGKNEN